MALEKGDMRGGALPATNPATGAVIGYVAKTPVEAVAAMYVRARAAQRGWNSLPLRERVRKLRRLRHIIADRVDEIARRIAASTGKPVMEALTTELLLVLSALQFVEKRGPRVLRRRRVPTPVFLFGKRSYVECGPKGVVLVISPWNFPFQLALVPTIYAVAAGNAVIVKPSEMTPLIGILIEELVAEAQFPPDLIQVAHGEGPLGAALVAPDGTAGQGVPPKSTGTSPSFIGPDHIFFTGSVGTGKIIQAEAAKRLIPTTLELSGKDAYIVFADAPLERAVNGAVWGAFMNSGQVCIGVERVYVERPLFDKFIRQMASRMAKLAPADDLTHGVRDDANSRRNRVCRGEGDIGWMTMPRQVEIVKEHVQDALAKGAVIVHGKPPDEWDGMFISPLILTDVTPDMRIARQETFGPVVTVTPFDDEAEAITSANDSGFGLNAAVWTRDVERGRRVARQLDVGGVTINDVATTIGNEHLPFGGVKQSGVGRTNGEAALRTFSHEKAIVVDWIGRRRDIHWFPYEGKTRPFASLLRHYFKGRRNWTAVVVSFVRLLRNSLGA